MNKMHIAKVAHEVNRAYCEALDDYSQAPWGETPEWQKNSIMDGVQAIMDRRVTSPGGAHRSWLEHKERDGWVYGEEKDAKKKTHPLMIPYEDLPEEQKIKDVLFFTIVTQLLANR